jgi:Mn-dependent DtxR family transcriptional regulator
VGAKGGKVALAWQYIWDRLNKQEYKDGAALCREAAEKFNIQPLSIQSHLHRMASEGILETEARKMKTTVTRNGIEHQATRARTHFRIAPERKKKSA